MIVDCYQVLGIKLECLQVFVISQNMLVVSSRDAHEDKKGLCGLSVRLYGEYTCSEHLGCEGIVLTWGNWDMICHVASMN